MFVKFNNPETHNGILCCLIAMFLTLFGVGVVTGQDEDPDFRRTGRLIRLPLPITGSSAASAVQQIREVVSQMPTAVQSDERAVLVLQFDTKDKNSGQGSDLGSCVSLAEFLVSPELNRVRTVAWISDNGSETALVGHAVLVASSCNEIAMDQNASIGNAGIDLDPVPDYVRDLYKGIAQQRRTLRIPVVLGMLDSNIQLERVTTSDRTEFATREQREKLQAEGDVTEIETVSAAGEPTIITSEQMEQFGLIKHRTTSRSDLARRFNVSSVELASSREDGRKWNAIQYTVPPSIDSSEVSWLIRAMERELIGKTDMVIFEFGDVQGDASATLRLAEHLAAYNRNTVRTVAWVSGNCEGIAGVAALSCDDIIFGPEGKLGSSEDENQTPEQLESWEITIRSVAQQKDRDWSLLMAILNPRMVVNKYRSVASNSLRLMGKAEYDELPEAEAARWIAMEKVDLKQGIDSEFAGNIGVSMESVAPSIEAVHDQFQLESVPQSLEPSSTERWLEDFAMFLNNPVVSMMLVMGAFICFMNELSAPGLGAFGFLGVLLLTAFFWSHHLEGNADWFEILLFIVGIVFVCIELFVVPGFGLFGVGGIAMVIGSLVLAGQDFIIPQDEADFEKLSLSMLPILGAFFGIVIGALVLQKVLPNSPLLRRMALAPPTQREAAIDGSDPEAVADFAYLMDAKGEAITPIMPSGKARIDGRIYDVITRGDIVQKGESVQVVEAIANRVVVRKI